MSDRITPRTGLVFLACLAATACSSGGGGGPNAGTTTFQVESLSVQDGAVWQINREIVFEFSEPIDFSTVSANTINIRSIADVPAIGVFRPGSASDPDGDRKVVFQPNCPTLDDFSDAGLQPGGITYVLRIPGQNTSTNTLRSVTGVPLGIQQTRTFSTPASSQASIVFRDTAAGPPEPIVRPKDSPEENATFVEIGGVPDDTVYFERDQNGNLVLSDPSFVSPLNLYSDRTSRIAVSIAFNQPVSPSADNLTENRLRLEFQDQIDLNVWHPIETRVTLAENCTETGASVRLEPVGVLPPASVMRAVVLPGFRDLVGEAVLQQDQVPFAEFETDSIHFTSLTPTDELSDEFNESFEFGGDSPLSFQDTDALFDTPEAEWGDGILSAAFSFEGNGGPGGDFDWVVHEGELFFFDTISQPVIGGPGGIPTTTQNAVNGVLDVRSLIIEQGGEIRVQGPNPLRINATQDVIIRGRLDLGGFNAKDVATLNTGNQVEVGAGGAGGGGKGGNANDNITGPTPRGGRGQGPFRLGSLGGQGGEMGFSNIGSKNTRRPGGGGGGRFTKDWIGTTSFTTLSLAAGAGSNGNTNSTGAESGVRPSAGGQPGEGPFLDANTGNDFFGVRPIVSGGQLTGLVRGELPSLWAGYGGGGGGNAGKVFPNPTWNFNSDEKGGGGGGGAGGMHIKALGRIVFAGSGVIVAIGGRGANGENTNFLDHIGGTGGGGSGGHIILESATAVDFSGITGGNQREVVLAAGPVKKEGPTEDVDSCSNSQFCCAQPNPPSPTPSNSCRVNSNGGPGGAGLIQIHVPDPTKPPGTMAPAEIVVPPVVFATPNPVDTLTSPPAYVMIPTFGRRSKARSDWISIGGADRNPDGSEGLVRFLFSGIDPVNGRILTAGPNVIQRPHLVEDLNLPGSSTARILADGFTLELTGAALAMIRAGTTSGVSNDVYLRTPALLQDCAVRMFLAGQPAAFEDFTIASAIYSEGAATAGDESLRVTVGGTRPLSAFNNPPQQGSTTAFRLLPRFFQVITDGLVDSLPTTAFVSVRFQAARDNGAGAPDEANPLQDWTSDIVQFNNKPPGALQFFRYEVEFDLDKNGTGISASTEPVTLDFLKIPFVF